MARTNASKTSNRVRSYEEILGDSSACGARKAVEKLTKKHGIAEFQIQLRIEMFRAWEFFGTGRRWSERFTIDRKSASLLAQRLRTDAEELRRALTPEFKFVIGGPLCADFICDLISRSAVLIEGSLAETNDRNADWTLEPKRELTLFIWRATGKPHDRELADIVAAVLRLESYTAEEQRKFRKRWCRAEGTDTIIPSPPKPETIPLKKV